MGAKKTAKGGFFRPIKAKAKSGRGGGDPADTWALFISTSYDELKEQFDGADEETQNAAKAQFNECFEEFGEYLFESKQMAEMMWTDAADAHDKIAKLLEESYMDVTE